MTIDVHLRDLNARQAALRRYAEAHDYWSEQEQLLVAEGRAIEAAGAHECALIALRGYRAEMDDREPREVEA